MRGGEGRIRKERGGREVGEGRRRRRNNIYTKFIGANCQPSPRMH